MNLNALCNPAGVNGVLYSRFLPAQNQVGGNYDAFAYLGLGVLIALPIAVIAARKRLAALLRRHWALYAVFVVLTAFAVSHVITANGVTLVTLPLPGVADQAVLGFPLRRAAVLAGVLRAGPGGLCRTGETAPRDRVGHSGSGGAALGHQPGTYPAA